MFGWQDGVELSMVRQKFWGVLVRDLEPISNVSDLSQLRLKDIGLHPCIHFGEAVCWGEEFGGDVGLFVIGLTVEMKTMCVYNVTKGMHVENEQ